MIVATAVVICRKIKRIPLGAPIPPFQRLVIYRREARRAVFKADPTAVPQGKPTVLADRVALLADCLDREFLQHMLESKVASGLIEKIALLITQAVQFLHSHTEVIPLQYEIQPANHIIAAAR